jgi:hypothetical protein
MEVDKDYVKVFGMCSYCVQSGKSVAKCPTCGGDAKGHLAYSKRKGKKFPLAEYTCPKDGDFFFL